MCATLKRSLISPIRVLDFESSGTFSFLDIFLFHDSNLLKVSVFDLWVSLTRDTIAPDTLHNFSYSVQMGRKKTTAVGAAFREVIQSFISTLPCLLHVKEQQFPERKKKNHLFSFSKTSFLLAFKI